jgi:hypothetical protein
VSLNFFLGHACSAFSILSNRSSPLVPSPDQSKVQVPLLYNQRATLYFEPFPLLGVMIIRDRCDAARRIAHAPKLNFIGLQLRFHDRRVIRAGFARLIGACGAS